MVKRGQPPAGYTTASRAKRMLGDISDGMLRTYVQKGEIERIVPSGRSQGFYKIADIIRLSQKLDEFKEPETPGPRFQQATEEDLPELVNFLIEVFGGGNTLDKRLQWYRKNPETVFIVRNRAGKGRIIGCVYVLPLTLEKIEEIFADPNPGSTRLIRVDDIQVYVPGKPMFLYIVSMGVMPHTSLTAKRTRGGVLIRGLIRFLIGLGRRGIHVQLLAARTNSPDGIRILRSVGFTEIESTTQSRNFLIEVDRSGVPLILPYKRAFRERQQSGL